MDSTIIRQVAMAAMLIGPSGVVADKVAAGFELAYVRVVRVGHVAAACERLAVLMPQVVVVLAALRQDERDALTDRATAVGALVIDIDPALDSEALADLITHAARIAVDRKMLRDEPGIGSAATKPPPTQEEGPAAGGDDVDIDVDSGW